MEKTKRYVYLDALRILAIMCVIFNHSGVNGFFLYTTTDNFIVQCVSIFISSFCKIGVPLFFMISGALLLRKEESYKELFFKRILRYIVILIVFCFIHFVYRVHRGEISFHIADFVRSTATGQIYMPYWFLYSYLGFLIGLPILRRMAKVLEKNEFLYLFLIYVIAGGIFGILARTQVGSIAVAIPFTADVIAYPLLGYFIVNRIEQTEYTVKNLLILIALAVVGLGIDVAVTQYDYHTFGGWSEAGLSLFIIFPAAAVFYAVKYFFDKKSLPTVLENIICIMGSCTFGVYLLEGYIKDYCGIIQKYMCLVMPNALAAIIYLFCIMIIGVIITFILKKIPVIKKLF